MGLRIETMEIAVGVVALAVALWQLKLQRDEIRLQSRLNSLIHIAGLIREKIEHHEQIIESLKARRSDWSGHAGRVNNELRPLLASINQELVESVSGQADGLDMQAVREALKLNSTTLPIKQAA
jgi:hypothetical protein